MTTVATLDTVMRLNSTAFQSGMIQAANTATTSLKSIQAEAQRTASVLDLARNAAAAWAGLDIAKGLLGGLLDAQVQLQSINYTLLSATGNGLSAANSMAFLRDESSKLGLSLPQAAEGFAKLSAAATASGVSMKGQQQLFDAFAKSSTTLHLSTDASSRALLALQEMFSRGTIQSRQLNQQLGQAIPGSAARFKNAVEEMTKGTDLQGQSFEKLIQGGKLVTTQFLPALIKALDGSGSGWEEASQGLNANLNRLSTAWFNLKTEISGGLFTDVASNGAALLAQNLDKVATTLELIAGVAAGRGLATAISNGVGVAQTAIQKAYTGPVMAASSTVQYAQNDLNTAEKLAKEAEAQALQNSLVLESAADARLAANAYAAEMEAIVEVTAAEVKRIETVIALREAMGSQTTTEQERVATLARLTVAQEANTAATLAQARANATSAAAAATEAQFSGKQNTLSGLSRIAQDGVGTAEQALASAKKAEAAFSGLGNAIGAAAKGFSSFALGLVGGPWGAAVLAIGGLVYAFASATSEAAHLEAQTRDNAKAVKELTDQASNLAQAFLESGNADPLSKYQDSVDQLGAAMKDQAAKILDAKATLQQYNDEEAKSNGWSLPSAVAAVQYSFNEITGKVEATTHAVAGLTAGQAQLQEAFNAQQAAQIASYGSAFDGLKTALSGMSMDLVTLPGQFDKLGAAIAGASDNADALDKSRAKFKTWADGIAATKDALDKKLRQKDMTPAARLQDDQAQALKNAAAGNVPDAAHSQALADSNAAISDQRKIDADEAAKKAASAAAAEAKKWANEAVNFNLSIDKGTASLQEQLGSTSKLTDAQKLQAEVLSGSVAAYNHETASQQAATRAALAHEVALSLQVKAQQEAKKQAEALSIVQENLARISVQSSREHSDALSGMNQGSQQNSDASGIREINRKYDDYQAQAGKQLTKGEITQDTYDQETKMFKAQLADELDAQQKFYDGRNTLQASWLTGAQKAEADFMESQKNNAAASESFFKDFQGGFEDVFTGFQKGVSGAKDAFLSFVDSMEARALKFVADKIMQSALDSFVGGVNATPGSTQGGASSLWGNLSNAFGFGKTNTSNADSTGFGVLGSGNSTGQMSGSGSSLTSVLGSLFGKTNTSNADSTGIMSGSSGTTLTSWLSSLFGGSTGSSGGSSSSTGTSSIWGSLAGLFGLAGGGSAAAGSTHQVAENGPEMLTVGSKSYMMMGNQPGVVTPNTSTSGGTTHVYNIQVQPTTTRRTATQMADQIARTQRVASSRNG